MATRTNVNDNTDLDAAIHEFLVSSESTTASAVRSAAPITSDIPVFIPVDPVTPDHINPV